MITATKAAHAIIKLSNDGWNGAGARNYSIHYRDMRAARNRRYRDMRAARNRRYRIEQHAAGVPIVNLDPPIAPPCQLHPQCAARWS